MNSRSAALDVRVQFQPNNGRVIIIGFRHSRQARAYQAKISQSSFHTSMNLSSQVIDERFVSIRLPGRVTDIVASTTWHGFYMVFSDQDVAKMWQDRLLLWKFVKGQTMHLYVDRNVDNFRLNEMLGIKAPVPTTTLNEPQPPVTSKSVPNLGVLGRIRH